MTDITKLELGQTISAQLLAANLQVLQQGLDLLAVIDDAQYTRTAPPLFAYGAGSHFRHCLDAYTCFLRDLPLGSLDYDQRERDETLAQNRQAARQRIATTKALLHELAPHSTSELLRVRQDGLPWASSSSARELQFLLSHTVHHYALIALLLRWQGVTIAEDFGVAPATLAHWQTAARA